MSKRTKKETSLPKNMDQLFSYSGLSLNDIFKIAKNPKVEIESKTPDQISEIHKIIEGSRTIKRELALYS